MITIDLSNHFLDRKENKIMSANDPKEPKKVSLVQQAEEGTKTASDCCGGDGSDDCCGDGGGGGGNGGGGDCCGG